MNLTRNELKVLIVKCLEDKEDVSARHISRWIASNTQKTVSPKKIAMIIRNMTGTVEAEKENVRNSSYRKKYKLRSRVRIR